MSTSELEYPVFSGILHFHSDYFHASDMAFLNSMAPSLIVGTLIRALAYRFIAQQRDLRV